MSQYVPGTCNIGPGEISRRRQGAVLGAFLYLLGFGFDVLHHYSRTSRLYLFIPALIFSVGWVQSRRKFCLAFGFMGTFNFGKLGQLTKIANPEDLKADRKTALSILGRSLIIAIALTFIAVLIPAK